MKEFIEKLIEKMQGIFCDGCTSCRVNQCDGVDKEECSWMVKIKESINQLVEEYNNGWIPYVTGCEMPNEASRVWLSFTTPIASFVKSAWYINGHFEWDNCKRVKETPMAWKPYNVPAPYQPKGE